MVIRTKQFPNGKWSAEATANHKLYVVGEFDSPEAAQSAVAGLVAGYPREWYRAPAYLPRWEPAPR